MANFRRAFGAAGAPVFALVTRRATLCDQPDVPPIPKDDQSFDESIYSPCQPWKRGWKNDWDGRHPKGLSTDTCRGKIRHILLIRHGQYELSDPDHGLTPLGEHQARATGKRLAAIAAGIKKDAYGEVKTTYSDIVSSNMLRAQQTAKIISQELPTVPRLADDVLLAEGFPVLPLPQGPILLQSGSTHTATILTDGPRMEAGFRKYIRRDIDHKKQSLADEPKLNEAYVPSTQAQPGPHVISPEAAAAAALEHEYIILVCHMNVIRYFVARALQLPPEAWLRMRGNNCGITEIIVQPSGQVSLGCFADTGHLGVEQITFH